MKVAEGGELGAGSSRAHFFHPSLWFAGAGHSTKHGSAMDSGVVYPAARGA